ncbi:MAG: pyruvate dehydrogenase (acetyl-transferring) E1 component subunit alpha [Chitinispirillales bacterium]|jgi:pyruvate dehydrogenase E1 component alpha subunit|nr:pyruvate dehydrogenase (acetyl-transferring) E1 component subunit alpha [Chitinispirillales bacterium]
MNSEQSTADDAQSKPLKIKLLKKMLLIRRFEEAAARMYGLQKIGGFCHLYIGQEAAAVGVIEALDLKRDYVLTAYRDHGTAIACGMESGPLMAELYGKESGCSKGKGGSMHFFDKKRHFFGGNGIVGAHIPLAGGVAMAVKYSKSGGAAVCFFGDGAIHQGSFHETLNMAAIWNLPALYICENNRYGMGTDFRRVSSVTDFKAVGGGYGIESISANGMDVIEVYNTVSEIIKKMRGKSAPVFLELKTYRYKGHSMSDPGRYRSREELDRYKEQDPVALLRGVMEKQGFINEEQFKKMDAEIKNEVEKAIKFAEESKEPPLESLYEDIFA